MEVSIAESKVHFAVPITKATDADDGSVFVEGLATTDDLDLDEQIIDKDFAFRGLTKWFTDWANIRQMHSSTMAPAGKAVEMQQRENGVWLKVKVVEPTAVRLVREGVYRAFSVGIAQPRIGPHPMAKGGAVLDGIFSEVSLVDFPANPVCRFDIAKRASATSEIEIVEKVYGVNGLNKAMEGYMAEETVAKRDFDSGVGGGTDRDKIPSEDFAGPNRTYPIVSPQDVADAASLIGHASNPDAVKRRIIAIARRKGSSFEAKLPDAWTKDDDSSKKAGKSDMPMRDDDGKPMHDEDDEKDSQGKSDSGKARNFNPNDKEDGDGDDDSTDDPKKNPDADEDEAQKAAPPQKKPGQDDDQAPPQKKPGQDDDQADDGPVSKSGLPYHLVRLHDALCPAYQEEDVLVAHPAAIKGVGTLISLDYFSNEVTKSLSLELMSELSDRSGAYQCAALVKNAGKAADGIVAELRKAFSEYYPNVGNLVPGSIKPGQFHRGFLSSATPEEAHGGNPGLASQAPLEGKTPKPNQFHRGELHPGTSHKSAQTSLQGAMMSLHDYLVSRNDRICAVEQPGGALADGPHDVPAVKQLENQQESKPAEVANPERVVTKAADIEAHITKVFGEKLGKVDELVNTLEELTKRVKDLEAMPDPATVAVRNASARGQLKPGAETRDAGNAEEVQRVVRLVKAARSHDSNVSVPAFEKLLNMVGPDSAAELMK